MLLKCGVGEDSWESLGLQGDPTSPSWRKSVLNTHWKDWCWSWNSNTLANWKDHDAGKDWRWEEKGTTEDEMVGQCHWLNGHEFEQALGVGDGQGSLACFSPWGHKELDTTERLNQTDRFWARIWCQLWRQQQAFWSSSGIVARSASIGITEQWAGGSLGHHPSRWPPKFQIHLVDRNRSFYLVAGCCSAC